MDRPFSKLPPIGKPKIFIATPMSKYAMINAETAGYCALMNQHEQITWGFVNSMSPEFSRNSLIEHHFHKDPNWTHIFFIDSDIVPPQNALKNLLKLDADFATGVYPLYLNDGLHWSVSDGDDNWILMTEVVPPQKEPTEIQSCGGGCLLIRREVLVDIGWPWFKTEYQEIYQNKGKGIQTGEDVFFCKRAIEKGYKVIVEPSVVCKHFNGVDMLKIFNDVKRQLETEERCPRSSGDGA